MLSKKKVKEIHDKQKRYPKKSRLSDEEVWETFGPIQKKDSDSD